MANFGYGKKSGGGGGSLCEVLHPTSYTCWGWGENDTGPSTQVQHRMT